MAGEGGVAVAEWSELEMERGKYLALFREDVKSIRDELTDSDRLVIVNGVFDWFLGRNDGLTGLLAFVANRIKERQLVSAKFFAARAAAGRKGGSKRKQGQANGSRAKQNEADGSKRKQTETLLYSTNNSSYLPTVDKSENARAENAAETQLPTDGEMRLYASQLGVPESYLPEFLEEWRAVGWQRVNRGGSLVTLNRLNFKSQLGAFWRQRQKNAAAAPTAGGMPAVHIQADYELRD